MFNFYGFLREENMKNVDFKTINNVDVIKNDDDSVIFIRKTKLLNNNMMEGDINNYIKLSKDLYKAPTYFTNELDVVLNKYTKLSHNGIKELYMETYGFGAIKEHKNEYYVYIADHKNVLIIKLNKDVKEFLNNKTRHKSFVGVKLFNWYKNYLKEVM